MLCVCVGGGGGGGGGFVFGEGGIVVSGKATLFSIEI